MSDFWYLIDSHTSGSCCDCRCDPVSCCVDMAIFDTETVKGNPLSILLFEPLKPGVGRTSGIVISGVTSVDGKVENIVLNKDPVVVCCFFVQPALNIEVVHLFVPLDVVLELDKDIIAKEGARISRCDTQLTTLG